ncbi:MAG: iron-containing alcohol dehydrogenase [Candidatus Odinarchaeota archaeon]
MRKFNFYQPTRILFGWQRVNEVGKVIAFAGKRCLLVTVKAFPAMQPLFEKVIASCSEAGVGVFHFDGVIPNPTTSCVNSGSEMAVTNDIDVVLGVGGGSSIDTAKAIAVGATHGGEVWDYRLGQKRIDKDKVLPIIAVPTTAGTGSEVTPMAVIKNTGEKFKSALADWSLCPRTSIVDPELTLSLPPRVTAATGFDVFCHAFESYLHVNASEFSDLLALETIKKVVRHLPVVLKDGSNRESREALSWASTMGGLCITNTGTTLAHGIGMAIGGHAPDIMHGESLAIMYPEVNRWTWKRAVAKYAAVGRIFNASLENKPDEVAAEEACNEMDTFLKTIGLWMGLSDKNIPESELDAIGNDTVKLKNYTVHPEVPTLEIINNLIKGSYKR